MLKADGWVRGWVDAVRESKVKEVVDVIMIIVFSWVANEADDVV